MRRLKKVLSGFLCLALALPLPALSGYGALALESSIQDQLAFAYEIGLLQSSSETAQSEIPGQGLALVSISSESPISIEGLDADNLYILFDLRVTRTDGVTGEGSLSAIQNGWFTVKSRQDGATADALKFSSPVQSGIEDPSRRVAGEWVEMTYSLSGLDTASITNITGVEVADYNDFPKQNPPVSTGILYEVRNTRIVDISRGKDGASMEEYARHLRDELKSEIDEPIDESLFSEALLNAYQDVLRRADAVYSDPTSSMAAVFEATESIRMARPETDEEILERLEAKTHLSFDRSLFTAQSLAAYDEVCSWAAELQKGPMSRHQAQDAIAALDSAVEQLQTVVVSDIIYGDLDHREGVTSADALLALQAATQKVELDLTGQTAADVDGQSGVTAADALRLLQYATQKIDHVVPELSAEINEAPITFCNPLNLNYMYSRDYYLEGIPDPDPDNPTGYQSREAADPALVVFKGEYYLFASHNEGYWVSDNLMDWEYIFIDVTESEACASFKHFAPAPCVVGNTLYLTHSQNGAMIKTTNPRDPHAWELVGYPDNWSDPAMYYDDPATGGDGYVYLYQGSTPEATLTVCKLDPNNNMQKVGVSKRLFKTEPDRHGWEVPGENNTDYSGLSYVEGAWMNKYNGKYYLTYGAPTTSNAIYADGCYVADSPMGPFTYCENSPVAFKPSGFMVGAGHGCLFEDLNGNWWKVDSVVIMTKGWERRLAIYPAMFDDEGNLYTNTVRSDYPTYAPTTSENPFFATGPDWNLLSYGKPVTASSALIPASCAVDENMRTWWSAETGDAGEWLQVDLGRLYPIWSVQVNFADQDIPNTVFGRTESFSQRYLMEFSQDGQHWYTLVDRQSNTKDMPHDYIEFSKAVTARYIRITNTGPVPGHGKFAISGLRVFGEGQGTLPAAVSNFEVQRDPDDGRSATLTWQKAPDVQGYIVRFGTQPDALYNHYQVIGQDSLTINSLNKGVDYYFSIDAYNETGTTEGTTVLHAPAPPEKEPDPLKPVTIASFPDVNDDLMFLYGFCYQLNWTAMETGVDCSSDTSPNGAKEDYYLDATVTLTGVEGAEVDLDSFVSSFGVNLRSSDGKETDLLMNYYIDMQDTGAFTIHVPLAEMNRKDIDWSDVKEVFMLFYLADDYRSEDGQPSPYASMQITDVKIVQMVPDETSAAVP